MNFQREYVDLNTIYPEGVLESDTYEIKRVSLSEDQVRWAKMQSMMAREPYWMNAGLQPDFDYVKLVHKEMGIMMSDTPMERNTNRGFIQKANGDVLIFGLGLGLVIIPLLEAPEVKSITVVELYQDLIDTVTPILNELDKDGKLTVVQGDCFEYHKEVPKDKKWDCIYGDIWVNISSDNYDEMKTLTKNFKYKVNRDNPNAFIDHWLKDHCKSMYQEERAEERYWKNVAKIRFGVDGI